MSCKKIAGASLQVVVRTQRGSAPDEPHVSAALCELEMKCRVFPGDPRDVCQDAGREKRIVYRA